MVDTVHLKGCVVKVFFSYLLVNYLPFLLSFGVSIENNGSQSYISNNKGNSEPEDLSGLERSMGVVVSLRESFGFLQAVDRPKQMFFHVSEVPNDDEEENGNHRDIHQLISVTLENYHHVHAS